MRFIELIAQGVPGAKEALRFPFQPGLNVLNQRETFKLKTIYELLINLLYPTPKQTNTLGPGKIRRAELVLETRKEIFRISRDFANSTIQLSQLEPGSRSSFRELSSDLQFARETLARAAKLPSPRIFQTLLVSQLDDTLPSDSGFSRASSAPRAQTNKMKSAPDILNRIEGLKKELERYHVINKLGMETDELHARVFEIEDQLRRFEGPKDKLEDLNKEYEPYAFLDEPGLITPQIKPKLQAYNDNCQRRAEELTQLEEKSTEWASRLVLLRDHPWWRETLGLVGAGLFLVGFIATGFLRSIDWAFTLSLLFSVMALGVTGWGFYQGLRRKEKIAELKGQILSVDSEKAGIEKRFEIETVVVRQLFEKVHCQDPDEILRLIKERAELSRQRKDVEDKVQSLRKEIPEEDLRKERASLQEKISKIGAQLSEMPPPSLDPNSIKKEIARLESELKNVDAFEEIHAVSSEDDEVNQLVSHAAEVMDQPVFDIVNRIHRGLGANLVKFSGQQFNAVELRGERIAAFRFTNARSLKWIQADSATRAMLLFAVQFTLWQFLLTQKSYPFILDLVTNPKSHTLFQVCLQAAKYVAQKTQVLVFSS